MADRYVSSLAAGGGSGTSGSPWTLAEAASTASNADRVFVKNDGTYGLTSTLTFAQSALKVIGYTSTITDGGIATIRATSSIAGNLISATNFGNSFEGLILDCNSNAQTGITGGNETTLQRCAIRGFTVRGANLTGSQCVVGQCEVTGGVSGATAGIGRGSSGQIRVYNSVIAYNACTGAAVDAYSDFINCIIAYNSGASSDGINAQYSLTATNCIIHGNGRHGINILNSYQAGMCIQRNVVTDNGTNGINRASSTSEQIIGVDFNAFRGNGTSAVSGFASGVNDITLTASPFTNSAGGDFSLNNSAGGGAVLRALNFALPGISTTRYPFGGWYAPGGGSSSSLPPFR